MSQTSLIISGAGKVFARKNYDHSRKGLDSKVPQALESVHPPPTIWRHARKYFRYMDVHRKDLTLKAAEYAMKKYRSYRQVPNSIMMDIDVIVAASEWTVHIIFDCACKEIATRVDRLNKR